MRSATRAGVQSHHGPDCTCETILRHHDLTDPVLWRLAATVYEADVDDGRYDAPDGPGFDLALRQLLLGRDPA